MTDRDHRGRPAGASREVGLESGDVAEGRRHEHELGVGQLEDRNLPGPSPVGIGVEMELVHHDLTDTGAGTVAQRDVGQDLGGAADDRRTGIDAGVAGHHADVVGAERRRRDRRTSPTPMP